jgi:hypothetical protein
MHVPSAAPFPPLTPITPHNILNKDGYPVRNDNTTNYAYVGNGTGTTSPEMYTAYHPGQQANPSPIHPGQTTIMQNLQTGMWCRIADFSPKQGCLTQGMLCDVRSSEQASQITYNGIGLSYQGMPLVQQKGTKTLLLTDDPTCTELGTDWLDFPPGGGCRVGHDSRAY